MRYGHTSIINLLARLVMSLSGFVATIVLTRTLGQDSYGTYVVVISVLAWATMAEKLGIPQVIRKRVSEDENYVITGAIAQFGLYSIVAVCLWAVRHHINNFLGVKELLKHSMFGDEEVGRMQNNIRSLSFVDESKFNQLYEEISTYSGEWRDVYSVLTLGHMPVTKRVT